MKQIDIVLGGRTFKVSQLAIRADANWRNSVREIVEPISELAMSAGLNAPTPERLMKLGFTSALIIDPGQVLEALLSYSPELRSEEEWIGDNAFADEALTAVLTLFFGMTSMASGAVPKLAPTT